MAAELVALAPDVLVGSVARRPMSRKPRRPSRWCSCMSPIRSAPSSSKASAIPAATPRALTISASSLSASGSNISGDQSAGHEGCLMVNPTNPISFYRAIEAGTQARTDCKPETSARRSLTPLSMLASHGGRAPQRRELVLSARRSSPSLRWRANADAPINAGVLDDRHAISYGADRRLSQPNRRLRGSILTGERPATNRIEQPTGFALHRSGPKRSAHIPHCFARADEVIE